MKSSECSLSLTPKLLSANGAENASRCYVEETCCSGEQRKTQTIDPSAWTSLQDILRARARSVPIGSLILYPAGSTESTRPTRLSYSELYTESRVNSQRIANLPGFIRSTPILLHLEDHHDAIVWFWSVLLAEGIPVMSSPLSNIDENRKAHLKGLSELFMSPICITRTASLSSFEDGTHTLQLHTIESINASNMGLDEAPNQYDLHSGISDAETHHDCDRGQPAVLMLTSGSTGNAKAVRLRHDQLLASVAGKLSIRPMPSEGAFLNWIGLDHVAALTETHLTALWLGVDQVHVHAADIIASPPLFMDLLSRHRVSRTFAPNFFLAQLVASNLRGTISTTWDMSNLTAIISGGEANDVDTISATAALFGRYGAPPNLIQPGFGMTETCAGAIYNLACPSCDIKSARSVASLGCCMPGIEMRVVDDTAECGANQPGHLEVRGVVVFDGYYRNPVATAEAFASGNGWFRTGDRAIIDESGNMSMIGRVKDVININGIKIVTADVQAALESALRGTCVKRVICFPSRLASATTEQITVAYLPLEGPLNAKDLALVYSRAVQACMMISMTGRPQIFMIPKSALRILPLTSLGKISGAKMRELFEAGAFDEDVAYHRQMVDELRQQELKSHEEVTKEEELLRFDFAETKRLDPESISINTPIFELGFSSLDLIRLKHRVSQRLSKMVTILMLMKNPTIRMLAKALSLNSSTLMVTSEVKSMEYDPIIMLRSGGTKTPLWLIHPGVGEVLVFVGLAQHMRDSDRPIYALRARGFESGQQNFSSIAEAVKTYAASMRRKQPYGPYAIAGYSYGAMLAFETAKVLDGEGKSVVFLGSFNLPPHIKHRMRQLTWNTCLLHLCQFLGAIDEKKLDATAAQAAYCNASRVEALRSALELADTDRLQELGLDEVALLRWNNVAFGLQSMATDYEPSGFVPSLDIFHAEPLRIAAASRDEWVTQQLSQWKNFSRMEPRFHEVGGGHYTMIGPDHVAAFSKVLQEAMAYRGI